MSDTECTLPPAEKMMQGLTAVNDHKSLIENFYPSLTRHAGEQRSPTRVVDMLLDAISDYVDKMPPNMMAAMHAYVRGWLEVLILDLPLMMQARNYWDEVKAQIGTD